MREARSDRARKQADRQRTYRRNQKIKGKPSRDDVSRVALHWIITRTLKLNQHDQLAKWSGILVKGLVRQGFDEAQSWKRVDELIDRYEDGWTFRRKLRLDEPTDR